MIKFADERPLAAKSYGYSYAVPPYSKRRTNFRKHSYFHTQLQLFYKFTYIPTRLRFYPFFCRVLFMDPEKQSQVSGFLFFHFSCISHNLDSNIFILMLDDIVVSYQYYYYSLLVLLACFFSITFVFRSFIIAQIKQNYKTKKWCINTIIIGTGVNANKIARGTQG